MAKLTRTKEIWHIPKRGNVHQTIYMVHVLTWDRFLGKSWSAGKQEVLGSEMGKAGLTDSGKAITHQSIRTLLANLPKYLGFIFIDESSRPPKILVTDIGYQLIKKYDFSKMPKHRNLKEYEKAGDLIQTSDEFRAQMSKLIITNPSIRNDCQNILVFPFRMTLKLLLELEYLDKEEIGYILFHTKTEDELMPLIERIKNFRALQPEKRTAEIEAYRKTEEGNLTLVKAPTSVYYMYLCHSTGLCQRTFVKVNKTKNSRLPAIKLKDPDTAKGLLKKAEGIEIYDFRENWFLWNEYFSKPGRVHPPFDLKLTTNSADEILVAVYKDDYIAESEIISDRTDMTVPVFPDEPYKVVAYDSENGDEIFKEQISFPKGNRSFQIKVTLHRKKQPPTKTMILDQIREMFSGEFQGFDKDYFMKLKTIEKVLGKNYVDNRRKGGRLEYLFWELFQLLKRGGVVDEVFWYGKTGKYGICEPAPGGKEGNPDITFEIDEYLLVLELTTFRGNRAQWGSAEASSVPDHISKFKRLNRGKKVIGIFSAPSIHHQLEQNLRLNAREKRVGMIFKPCIEFADYLAGIHRDQLKKDLIEEARRQIQSST